MFPSLFIDYKEAQKASLGLKFSFQSISISSNEIPPFLDRNIRSISSYFVINNL